MGVILLILAMIFSSMLCVYSQNISNSNATNLTVSDDSTDSYVSNSLLVTFHLYTRNNPEVPTNNIDELDPSLVTKIIVHGYKQNRHDKDTLEFKDTYLKIYDCNVVVVDWSKYSSVYFTAVKYSRSIGFEIADKLYAIFKHKRFFEKVHMIGYSLGAHIAGYAGKRLMRLSEDTEKIERITALDPAMPLIDISTPEYRLDKSDAVFVDVVHTDISITGISKAIGTVDFYPNGGKLQPGCIESPVTLLNTINQASCNHGKSKTFFLKSLVDASNMATRCDSWSSFRRGKCSTNEKIIFGEHAPMSASGKFYLKI